MCLSDKHKNEERKQLWCFKLETCHLQTSGEQMEKFLSCEEGYFCWTLQDIKQKLYWCKKSFKKLQKESKRETQMYNQYNSNL